MSFLLYFVVRGGGSGGSHEKEEDMRGLRERRTNGGGALCAVRRAWQRRSEDGATPRRGYLFPSKKVRAKDSISSHHKRKEHLTQGALFFCEAYGVRDPVTTVRVMPFGSSRRSRPPYRSCTPCRDFLSLRLRKSQARSCGAPSIRSSPFTVVIGVEIRRFIEFYTIFQFTLIVFPYSLQFTVHCKL